MRIMCLDVGAATIQFGLMQEGRKCFCDRSEMPTRGREGAEAVLARISKVVERYEGGMDCISICTRGRIDEKNGEILMATTDIPGWEHFPLVSRLKERFGVPVVLINDTTALALGEAHYGSMRDKRDVLCINIGSGIGGVMVHEGAVQWMGSCRTPEMGHITLHPDGRRCACGRLGCFEAYASAHALIKSAACRLRRRTLTGRELFCLIDKGDETAKECLDAWAREVALGLSNLICVMTPECIVLGGGIMQQKAALEAVRAHLKEICMDGIMPAEVQASALGSAAGLYGCVVAARQKLENAENVAE